MIGRRRTYQTEKSITKRLRDNKAAQNHFKTIFLNFKKTYRHGFNTIKI